MSTGIEEAVTAAAIRSLVNWVDLTINMLVVNALDVTTKEHRHVGFIIGGHTQVSCECRLARQGGLNPDCGCEWTQDR